MGVENKGIYFTELSLQNVRCFGEHAILKLSNDKGEWGRWNVILGDNGTGKTTLLQCLAGMRLKEYMTFTTENNIQDVGLANKKKFWGTHLLENPSDTSYSKIQTEKSPKTTVIQSEIVNASGEKLKIGITQRSNISKADISYGHNISNFLDLFILGYGANRRISFNIFLQKDMNPEISETLFDEDAKLINTEEWLYQMDYSAYSYIATSGTTQVPGSDNEIRRFSIDFRKKIENILIGILPDISAIRFSGSEKISQLPKIEFQTLYGWVGLHQLSYGYKTMVAWIVDVAARMFEKYPDSENPLEEPVVILVDEIDLHLHPRWQSQIFDFLEKRFPKAQFIVTAHSPMIVQSAPKDANIIVLKKERMGADNVVIIDNNKKSVWNWRLDQIMASDIFGLEGLRNPEIEQQMRERTLLLQRDESTLTAVEKARLDELNEISYSLPTADNPDDIEAMEIIRQAAAYLKKQKANDKDKK